MGASLFQPYTRNGCRLQIPPKLAKYARRCQGPAGARSRTASAAGCPGSPGSRSAPTTARRGPAARRPVPVTPVHRRLGGAQQRPGPCVGLAEPIPRLCGRIPAARRSGPGAPTAAPARLRRRKSAGVPPGAARRCSPSRPGRAAGPAGGGSARPGRGRRRRRPTRWPRRKPGRSPPAAARRTGGLSSRRSGRAPARRRPARPRPGPAPGAARPRAGPAAGDADPGTRIRPRLDRPWVDVDVPQ